MQHRKSEQGLSIFEILTVVLIISILVTIALPNFIGNKERSKNSSMEANARTLRIMLETYQVDHKIYPEDLRTLGREATLKGYNKNLTNPYTNARGEVESGKWAIDYLGTNGPAGMVTYQPLASNDKYYIFGYDGTGSLHRKQGKVFTMSNG
jgi:competence protein ComGC